MQNCILKNGCLTLCKLTPSDARKLSIIVLDRNNTTWYFVDENRFMGVAKQYIVPIMLYPCLSYFYLTKGGVTLFQPKTIFASFLASNDAYLQSAKQQVC